MIAYLNVILSDCITPLSLAYLACSGWLNYSIWAEKTVFSLMLDTYFTLVHFLGNVETNAVSFL